MTSKAGKRVYLARFAALINDGERFVKIGISRHRMQQRFFADRDVYSVELLAETTYYSAADALIVESNLHEMFSAHRFKPSILLRSGGNTECFDVRIVPRVLAVLSGKRCAAPERSRAQQRSRKAKRSELTLPDPVAFAVTPEFALSFAALAQSKYGHRLPTTADRVSRYRPDVGVMFRREAERFSKREKQDPWNRP
jgi:hypothetical protein